MQKLLAVLFGSSKRAGGSQAQRVLQIELLKWKFDFPVLSL